MYHSWLCRKCRKPENRYRCLVNFFKHYDLWNYDKSWKVKANWHSLLNIFPKRTMRQSPWKCKIKRIWQLLLNISFLRGLRPRHVKVTRQSAKLGLGPGGTSSWVNMFFAVNAVHRLKVKRIDARQNDVQTSTLKLAHHHPVWHWFFLFVYIDCFRSKACIYPLPKRLPYTYTTGGDHCLSSDFGHGLCLDVLRFARATAPLSLLTASDIYNSQRHKCEIIAAATKQPNRPSASMFSTLTSCAVVLVFC